MLESGAVGLTAALAVLFVSFAPGIFNYIFPYSYGAIMGVQLGRLNLEVEETNVARQILAFISEQKRDGRQVAILPEAPILYAFTRTHAPSRRYTLLPGILSPVQEDAYIADLNRADPDYILTTARRSSEYGAEYLGIDYARKIYHWIETNYHVAGQFGRFRRDVGGSTLAALLYEKRGTWP